MAISERKIGRCGRASAESKIDGKCRKANRCVRDVFSWEQKIDIQVGKSPILRLADSVFDHMDEFFVDIDGRELVGAFEVGEVSSEDRPVAFVFGNAAV